MADTDQTGSLIPDIWRTIKNARDDAAAAAVVAVRRRDELDNLLTRMKAAGMAGHLPTLEEVQAAWRGEEKRYYVASTPKDWKLQSLRHDDVRSATIIASKTGKTLQDVRSWQNTELVMDTNAALAHGIINSVRALVIPPDALFHQLIV